MWIKLPWLENLVNTYARHTETLDSSFDLIRSHQQCMPWSPPLQIEPATTEPVVLSYDTTYNTCRIHTDAIMIIKTSEDFFKKYTSHFIWTVCVCERELETEQNCNILTPTLIVISVVFLVLLDCSTSLSGTCSHPSIFSPTGLQTHWGSRRPLLPSGGFLYHILLQLIWTPTHRLPVSPSYIIVQSPTQSLEWHVWSSSSGNNCHAVHRSLSSGASVYECTMVFLPCPIFLAKPASAISSHNCHRNVSLPSIGMACLAASKVNIQQAETLQLSQLSISHASNVELTCHGNCAAN